MTKSSMQQLIESGIIPQDTVNQLARWKVIPEEMASKAGSRPISLEKDSSEAQVFVRQLQEAVDREAKDDRETLLDFVGTDKSAQILFTNGRTSNVAVRVDKMHRVLVPKSALPNGKAKEIKQITLRGDKTCDVVDATPIYQSSKVVAFLCEVE